MSANKRLLTATFLIGIILPALYLYYFALLGWDRPGRGPLRSSIFTLPIILIPFFMVFVLPLTTIFFRLSQLKRQNKDGRVYTIALVVFQIIWGFWNFYLVFYLTD
ncbi:hypothetical protein [Candidatus Leptofilum sp.]|uniref:hypothetical protein n=1 Tax=Candidatus Leptofilum sp. TaxID=3241576 RepID=UPI003B58D154